MSYGKYLKEHGSWMLLFGTLFISVEIFLLTIDSGVAFMWYVAISMGITFFLGTYLDFRKTRLFLQKLEKSMALIDEKYLLAEMIEEPDRQEDRKIKELLSAIGKSSIQRIAQYDREEKEYRDYVETWVHEVKTPIAVMKMILANHQDADYGMIDEIERAERLVEQALFYARSNRVEKDYLINQVNLQKIVQKVILGRRRLLRANDAKIDLEDLDICVMSDGKWLEFMLGQIVDNAVKYRGDHPLTIFFATEQKENSIHLVITDKGMGIKAKDLDRVFDKGFTGENGRKGMNSTGFGLYLCKKLCDKLEHNISITSIEGESTTVRLIFPLSKVTAIMKNRNYSVPSYLRAQIHL